VPIGDCENPKLRWRSAELPGDGEGGFLGSIGHFEGREPLSMLLRALGMMNGTRPYKKRSFLTVWEPRHYRWIPASAGMTRDRRLTY
jgi:hypothetical protein